MFKDLLKELFLLIKDIAHLVSLGLFIYLVIFKQGPLTDGDWRKVAFLGLLVVLFHISDKKPWMKN